MKTYEITYMSRSGVVLDVEIKSGFSLKTMRDYAQAKVWHSKGTIHEFKLKRL